MPARAASASTTRVAIVACLLLASVLMFKGQALGVEPAWRRLRPGKPRALLEEAAAITAAAQRLLGPAPAGGAQLDGTAGCQAPLITSVGDDGWAGVTPAHNLTAAPALALYQAELAELLSRSAELLSWVGQPSSPELCSCFRAGQTAVVGNGPLSEEQRSAIAAANCIVRFNHALHKNPGERTDVWVVRGFHGQPLEDAWHIPSNRSLASALAAEAGTIVLVEDVADMAFFLPPESKEALQQANGPAALEPAALWPQAAAAFAAAAGLGDSDGSSSSSGAQPQQTQQQQQGKLALLELGALVGRWREMIGKLGFVISHEYPPSSPSTGFLGTMLALSCCLPEGGSLHLYGFNWSDQLDAAGRQVVYRAGHFMLVERTLVQLLAAAAPGRVVVHPTPCSDYYACAQ